MKETQPQRGGMFIENGVSTPPKPQRGDTPSFCVLRVLRDSDNICAVKIDHTKKLA